MPLCFQQFQRSATRGAAPEMVGESEIVLVGIVSMAPTKMLRQYVQN